MTFKNPTPRGHFAAHLVVASVPIALLVWIAYGAFVPTTASTVTPRPDISYVLVAPPVGALVMLWLLTFAALAALSRWHARRTLSIEAEPLRLALWAAPALFPLLVLFNRQFMDLTVVTYFLRDLAPFWLELLGAVVLVEGLRTAARRTPGLWRLALLGVPIFLGVVFTPALRFTGTLHGDEPKYLRYCESFFQGNGFDVSHNGRLTDEHATTSHVLGNLTAFARAVPEEAALLWHDAVGELTGRTDERLVSGPPSAGMFFEGKHPGTLYQLHNPGLSFLLFPGYFIDRVVTGRGVGYQEEFPEHMPAVYALLLLLFGSYSAALYLLLRGSPVSPLTAAALSAVGAIALPTGAFLFQIYPEVPAGIAVLLVVRYLLREPISSRPGLSLSAGLLAGFLPWLHVRFYAAAVVCVAWSWLGASHDRRSRLRFLAGALTGLAALSLYSYRLTGHLIPAATYGSELPISLERIVHGLPAFAFDSIWGLFPHSPIYLLALPGAAATWRRTPRATILLLLLLAAVAVPAAGHGFWAGGATPGRYLVAVAPLLLVFVADSLHVWGNRAWFRALTVLLVLVTVETAVSYNLRHVKEVGPLVGSGFSGWRPNLLFPSTGTEQWSVTRTDVVLLCAWFAAGLLVLGAAVASVTTSFAAKPTPWRTSTFFGVMALVALLGQSVASATGRLRRPEYLLPEREARAAALQAYAAYQPGCRCVVSGTTANVLDVLGNDVEFVDVELDPATPMAGRPLMLRIRPRRASGEYVVASVRLDLGDGTTTMALRQFGDVVVTHTYAQPGEFRVETLIRSANGKELRDVRLVRVTSP